MSESDGPAHFPGHSAPAAGFEVPLEMLAACHGRIERQCDTLRRLIPHLARHGADLQAREAAAAVVRYFDTAARDHHADEETDLFPALLEAMAASIATCVQALTLGLTTEHRDLEQRWRALRGALIQVAAGAPVEFPADLVDAFVERYRRHIEREDQELLPMAGRLLSDLDLDRIGRAMRARRGLGDLSGSQPAATPDGSTDPSMIRTGDSPGHR